MNDDEPPRDGLAFAFWLSHMLRCSKDEAPVFETWFNVLHLAMEAQEVIGLRTLKLVQGGTAAQDEALRMVAEKIDAGGQALCAMMSGAPAAHIVAGYRSEVQANAARLLGDV